MRILWTVLFASGCMTAEALTPPCEPIEHEMNASLEQRVAAEVREAEHLLASGGSESILGTIYDAHGWLEDHGPDEDGRLVLSELEQYTACSP